MRNNTKISGVFFALAFAYIAFNLRYVMMAVSFSNMLLSILIEFMAIVLFGVISVQLFAKADPLTASEKCRLIGTVALYAILCGITFDVQLSLTALNISGFSEALANNTALVWVAFLFKLVPLALGVLFACVNGNGQKEISLEFEDGMSPEAFDDAALLDAINDQFDAEEEAAASKKVIAEINEEAARETVDD